jgi:Rrf2 family nitric oxide-sensitive transcriptional repressor
VLTTALFRKTTLRADDTIQNGSHLGKVLNNMRRSCMLLRRGWTDNPRAGTVFSGVAHCDFALMRLTDYTDYSLRVMLYLAVRSEGLATIQDISDAYGISKNHLMKVVQRLGELGWVETVRGRNGGLRLFEHSGSLTVGEVVRATESDFALVGCFPDEAGSHRGCVIQSQCRLKGVLEVARHAFLSELDRHTIGELAEPAGPLAALLGMRQVIPIALTTSADGGAAPVD